ncbi:MAG: phosphate/phosphite/phosphonate ABC transporter substrate-binding protein [Candidatus Methanoperedens sp.]|nr:phosphate/phosphite/phosphonate ABC transporter substrate-binding protein [Candidatus Methanoperedens sp.]
MNKRLIYLSMVLILLIGFAWYYYITRSLEDTIETVQEPKLQQQNTISIGVVSEDPTTKIKLFQPAADYLAARLSDNQTKYTGKVIVANSLENASGLLNEQKLDIFLESPFSSEIVSKKTGSKLFLRRWKDGVAEYHSIFIVKKNSSIGTLNDLKGKTIVFEDPGSTSGYLLPKAYLLQKGFNLSQSRGQNNIVFVFSGSGENTPLWVIGGKADAGSFSNMDLEKVPVPIREQLKVIDRTVDVPRHLVSHRSGLDPSLVERIRQIFLNMDKDPDGIEILNMTEKTKKFDELSEDMIFNISKMVDQVE